MPASIFGERFLGRREPAWHKLGRTFADGREITVYEAFGEADLLYSFLELTPWVTLPNGEQMVLDRKAVLRAPTDDDPQYKLMTVADPDFGVIQHTHLARQLEPIAKIWGLETCGALDDGKVVFVTFKLSSYEIGGDEITQYLLVSDGKGGDHALRFAIVNIRVVCANTLEAAWSGAEGRRIAFPHRKDVADDLALYANLFAQVAAAQKQQREAFQALATVRLSPVLVKSTVEDIARVAYPDPAKKNGRLQILDAVTSIGGTLTETAQEIRARENELFEAQLERAKLLRAGVSTCYERLAEQNPAIAGTLWAIYNAIAEVSDCRRAQSEASAAASALWGERMLERGRAFRACWKLVPAGVMDKVLVTA